MMVTRNEMPMLRLGAAFSWREKVLGDILSNASCAEEAGVDSIWMPEAWGRDAFMSLAAVARSTHRVKLGTGIVNVYSRSPAALTMSAATLDELSNGRAILGLGTSGPGVVERWHGIPYDRPLTRIRETVKIARLALSGATTNFQGTIFRVSDFKLAMDHPQHKIPIYLAALGPKMLALAGEIADGVLLYLRPLPSIPNAISEILKGVDKAGRQIGDLDVAALLPTAVSENSRDARDEVAKAIAYYVGGMGTYYRQLVSESGFESEAAMIRSAWERGDRISATKAVSDRLIDSVAVAGSPDECRKKLGEFRSSGVTLPILSLTAQARGGIMGFCESIKAVIPE
jgi:F420-dependent oxidoreductase-like protein